MLDIDTILYFAYMDSYEKEDEENRSTEKNRSVGESESHKTKNNDENIFCPESTRPR